MRYDQSLSELGHETHCHEVSDEEQNELFVRRGKEQLTALIFSWKNVLFTVSEF